MDPVASKSSRSKVSANSCDAKCASPSHGPQHIDSMLSPSGRQTRSTKSSSSTRSLDTSTTVGQVKDQSLNVSDSENITQGAQLIMMPPTGTSRRDSKTKNRRDKRIDTSKSITLACGETDPKVSLPEYHCNKTPPTDSSYHTMPRLADQMNSWKNQR